jgi:hypothetical protein
VYLVDGTSLDALHDITVFEGDESLSKELFEHVCFLHVVSAPFCGGKRKGGQRLQYASPQSLMFGVILSYYPNIFVPLFFLPPDETTREIIFHGLRPQPEFNVFRLYGGGRPICLVIYYLGREILYSHCITVFPQFPPLHDFTLRELLEIVLCQSP